MRAGHYRVIPMGEIKTKIRTFISWRRQAFINFTVNSLSYLQVPTNKLILLTLLFIFITLLIRIDLFLSNLYRLCN